MRSVDVLAPLQDAIATVQADVDKKHITLAFDLKAGQRLITGDAVRLQQVFWNVLKNAVKFTPEGGQITVETHALPGEKRVAIKITDTGIGLTADEIASIFNAFSQGEHAGISGSHQFGGLGLGLAISRMLVEHHSGTIQAKSEGRARGATFIIEFPLCDATDVDEETTSSGWSPPASPEQPGGRRILLIEDHEPTRAALAHLLERRHYRVLAAASMAEAKALASRETFDLVLSDIGLPDGDGYVLMAALRDKFGLKGIALTGYGMDQDVIKARDSGFVAHLTKPIRVEALEKALAAALRT
jgi:CheY-like chemotaxis protein/two-component sensor histidine kinase